MMAHLFQIHSLSPGTFIGIWDFFPHQPLHPEMRKTAVMRRVNPFGHQSNGCVSLVLFLNDPVWLITQNTFSSLFLTFHYTHNIMLHDRATVRIIIYDSFMWTIWLTNSSGENLWVVSLKKFCSESVWMHTGNNGCILILELCFIKDNGESQKK